MDIFIGMGKYSKACTVVRRLPCMCVDCTVGAMKLSEGSATALEFNPND